MIAALHSRRIAVLFIVLNYEGSTLQHDMFRYKREQLLLFYWSAKVFRSFIDNLDSIWDQTHGVTYILFTFQR